MERKNYALSIKKINLSQESRANRTAPVTKEERGALRTDNGRLAWLGRHTRPDLRLGLQQSHISVESTMVGALQKYNSLVGREHKGSDVRVIFRSLRAKRPEDLVALVWGDRRHANIKDGSDAAPLNTQAGL